MFPVGQELVLQMREQEWDLWRDATLARIPTLEKVQE